MTYSSEKVAGANDGTNASSQDGASSRISGFSLERTRPSRGRRILATALLLTLVSSGVAMFGPFVDEAKGILALVMLLVLIFLRVPVAVALIVPALLGIWAIRGLSTVEGALSRLAFDTVAQWSLGVLPMFVFMGLLLWRAGIAESVYLAARRWLGWLPGGLAVGTNLAGAGLAAVSGSTLATTYALGRSGIPEMLKAGYSPRLATASVVASGLPGQLIPPSVMLVIYAGIAQVPVGPQLLAGIGPGIVVAVLFGATFAAIALRRPRTRGVTAGPDEQSSVSWRLRWASLLATWPVFAVMVIIFFGIFSGIFTPTEAGSVAALLALIAAFVWTGPRRIRKVVADAAISTVSTTGAIFLLLIGATALSLMLTLSGVSTGLAEWVTAWDLGRIEFLLIMVVVYLVMGMFLDPLAMMLLTVPVLVPVLEELGVSLLWYGVFTVFMSELAVVTPPVGILAYIVHGMVQDPEVNQGQVISLRDVFLAVAWILPVAICMCLLLIFFPAIATFIPGSGN